MDDGRWTMDAFCLLGAKGLANGSLHDLKIEGFFDGDDVQTLQACLLVAQGADIGGTDHYGYAYGLGMELELVEELPAGIRPVEPDVEDNEIGEGFLYLPVGFADLFQDGDRVAFVFKEVLHEVQEDCIVIDNENMSLLHRVLLRRQGESGPHIMMCDYSEEDSAPDSNRRPARAIIRCFIV